MKRRSRGRSRKRRNRSCNGAARRMRARDPVLERMQKTRGLAPQIAQACGITREAVWNWPRVPAKHVLAVEDLLDIPRHEIRPDIYPPPYHPRTKQWLLEEFRQLEERAQRRDRKSNNNGRRQHGSIRA